MAPQPRRKDEHSHREEPEGEKRVEEGEQQAVEEFTGYRETGPDRNADAAAEREAGLQPGRRPKNTTGRRDASPSKRTRDARSA